MRLYLDDTRDAPHGWTLCKTAKEVIEYIDAGLCKTISFDHDLGTKVTGYDVAKHIEEMAASGKLKTVPEWYIHSANPVGRKNISAAMESAERILMGISDVHFKKHS